MEEIRQRRALAKERLLHKNQQRTDEKNEANTDNCDQSTVTTENGSADISSTSLRNSQDSNECSDENAKRDEDGDLEERNHEFVAFARIFCGTIKRGDKLYILNYNKANSKAGISSNDEFSKGESSVGDVSGENVFEVNDLFLWMGRQLELLDEVPAGNILGLHCECI